WGPGAPPKPCVTDADCTDNNDCNGIEYCDPMKLTCAIKLMDCDDKNPCTMDSCDPMTGCAHMPLDGVPCAETCLPVGMCNLGVFKGARLDCADNNVCPPDGCAPARGCTHTPVAGDCDDGTACTTNDVCQNGICVGVAIDCNDANICTDDTCEPVHGCVHV